MASKRLSHAKRRALRDAILTGGLRRYGFSFMYFNPHRPDIFYQSNTICALVTDGLMSFRTVDGHDVVITTRAGLAALNDSWRPAGAQIPPGAISDEVS